MKAVTEGSTALLQTLSATSMPDSYKVSTPDEKYYVIIKRSYEDGEKIRQSFVINVSTSNSENVTETIKKAAWGVFDQHYCVHELGHKEAKPHQFRMVIVDKSNYHLGRDRHNPAKEKRILDYGSLELKDPDEKSTGAYIPKESVDKVFNSVTEEFPETGTEEWGFKHPDEIKNAVVERLENSELGPEGYYPYHQALNALHDQKTEEGGDRANIHIDRVYEALEFHSKRW